MKKHSHFRVHVLPWILYGIGAAATVAVLLSKCIYYRQTPAVRDTVFLTLFGLVLGFIVIFYLHRKKDIKRYDYIALKNGMFSCWFACLLAVLVVQIDDWVYSMSVPVASGCAAFMLLYLTRYARYYDEQQQIIHGSRLRTDTADAKTADGESKAKQ